MDTELEEAELEFEDLHEPGLTSPPRRRRLRTRRPPRWIVRTLAMYLTSRLLVALAVLMSIGIAPPGKPGYWLEIWDSFFYADIARHGYPSTIGPISPDLPYSPFAFFPLWPMLMRGGGWLLGGNVVLAGYILNFLLGALLAVLVRMLFARVTDGRTADLGVLIFVFFPGTNVFSTLYSEPLALCLAAGTLLMLLRHRWVEAGLLAALAGATRPPVALAVFAALAWAVLVAVHRRRDWRALIALPLAPLGLIAFAAYGWVRTGNPLAWHEAEKMFGNKLDFGASFVHNATGSISTDGSTNPVTGLAVLVGIGTIVLVGLALLAVRRPPPAILTIYAVVAIALPAMNSALLPKARFIAAGFPLLLPLAVYLRDKGREHLIGARDRDRMRPARRVHDDAPAVPAGLSLTDLRRVLAEPCSAWPPTADDGSAPHGRPSPASRAHPMRREGPRRPRRLSTLFCGRS